MSPSRMRLSNLYCLHAVNRDVEPEAAVAALDAICAQIDFVRGLRECSHADAQLDVARHNLVRLCPFHAKFQTFIAPLEVATTYVAGRCLQVRA